MNEQLLLLSNLLIAVKLNLPEAREAMPLLRTICRNAADTASNEQIVCMAQLLYDFGTGLRKPAV